MDRRWSTGATAGGSGELNCAVTRQGIRDGIFQCKRPPPECTAPRSAPLSDTVTMGAPADCQEFFEPGAPRGLLAQLGSRFHRPPDRLRRRRETRLGLRAGSTDFGTVRIERREWRDALARARAQLAVLSAALSAK